MDRNLEDLQRSLDLKKWHESEDNGIDMCRHFDYCVYCKFESDFPCARAYTRMEHQKEKAEAPKKAPVAKKPAAKK